MNPSPPSDIWCNPPPPGTFPPDLPASEKDRFDNIEPLPKNAEHERRHRHKRRRSRSRHRHRRHRHSSSRSRSRSRRRHHHRRHSRSRSRRRSHKRSRRSRSPRRSRSRRRSPDKHKPMEEPPVQEEEEDDDEEEEPVKENAFKNDGSFMEMFKKMQEEQKAKEAEEKADAEEQTRPAFGKRRGGKVLKTGMVQKSKCLTQEEMDSNAQDAWTLYMKEVKRYKEACCDDDSKTRLLVK